MISAYLFVKSYLFISKYIITEGVVLKLEKMKRTTIGSIDMGRDITDTTIHYVPLIQFKDKKNVLRTFSSSVASNPPDYAVN